MKKIDTFLVIMAGGSGTRFWPKSTSKRPKQLLAFGRGSQQSLLMQTLSRFEGLVPESQRMIVTTRSIEAAVKAQAGGARVLAEPQGRNTAPCVYWAAREVAAADPRGVMLVMPADHYIARPESFRETVMAATEKARKDGSLVTLGVKPTRPETGYGYLKIGQSLGGGCSQVDAFVEKPKLEKAREFLASGDYLWNGGMFVWRADAILAAFDRFMPEMKRHWEEQQGKVDAAYPLLTATSIDYGIMEKADDVVSFTLDCGWDDLGSWTSLESMARVLGAETSAGAVTSGELVAIESKGHIVDAPGRVVAVLGVDDLIIVEQGDALLIARKDRAQDIKLVVEHLKKSRPELV